MGSRSGSSPLTRGKRTIAGNGAADPRLIPAHAGKTVSPTSMFASAWAHPRSRGENSAVEARVLVDGGSSPLTRGKLVHLVGEVRRGRLIPAHAGKTKTDKPRGRVGTAHPRSRGENELECIAGQVVGGSSPLTRGKPPVPRYPTPRDGLIPAHAGKTEARRKRHPTTEAHPRSRGENLPSLEFMAIQLGSSPLTRGKLLGERLAVPVQGLIPAHAGKTRADSRTVTFVGAHPRSRGENAGGFADGDLCGGSSPLTRGKLTPRLEQGQDLWLIPAHAGKTTYRFLRRREDGAHPRSRGENNGWNLRRRSSRGSSPLTRGKHGLLVHAGHVRGLIPAHAGKTRPTTVPSRCPGAHPRSRGENIIEEANPLARHGSSPLTRGKQRLEFAAQIVAGLIPAHAGKTRSARSRRACPGAHPRSRGENATGLGGMGPYAGSSPLTRGKRPFRGRRHRGVGLIPAHAGKTRTWPQRFA